MEAAATPQPLRFGRHIVGMMILALANPLIYFDPQSLYTWISYCLITLAVAAVVYGLYALFFTARAKSTWPRNFFILAWTLAALNVLGGWSQYNKLRSTAGGVAQQQAQPAAHAVPEQTPQTDRFGGILVEPSK